ncbi:hypothetical protein [Streptomyces sp900116325]
MRDVMSEGPFDVELLRAAQSGEVAAVVVLIERHRAAMRAVALGVLG